MAAKFDVRGLDKLKRELKDIQRRATQLSEVQVQVDEELTPQEQEAIAKNLGEHIFKGKPLKTKW